VQGLAEHLPYLLYIPLLQLWKAFEVFQGADHLGNALIRRDARRVRFFRIRIGLPDEIHPLATHRPKRRHIITLMLGVGWKMQRVCVFRYSYKLAD
jgi:hypothetical protein